VTAVCASDRTAAAAGDEDEEAGDAAVVLDSAENASR